MKKFIGILVLATFLLSGVAFAEEASYTYGWVDRFADKVDLVVAKLTINKVERVQNVAEVLQKIVDRRTKHIQSHPDDLVEVQKLKEDVDKMDKLGVTKENFEKHLATLEAVKVKLEAKNLTTTGIQNAIDNANRLIAKKNETKKD